MESGKITQNVFHNPAYFIAFGFGSGLSPYAPGTCGTLVAIPLCFMMMQMHSIIAYIIITILAFALGVWVCQLVTNALGEHDYSGIVWDEVVGYLITMIGAPLYWGWFVIGFLLFRLLDIWKPRPIRDIDERVKGGLGIMLDDVAAALPAWLILQILIWGFSK